MNPYASPQAVTPRAPARTSRLAAALVAVLVSAIAVFYSVSRAVYQESLATPDAVTKPLGIHDPHGTPVWVPDEIAKKITP